MASPTAVSFEYESPTSWGTTRSGQDLNRARLLAACAKPPAAGDGQWHGIRVEHASGAEGKRNGHRRDYLEVWKELCAFLRVPTDAAGNPRRPLPAMLVKGETDNNCEELAIRFLVYKAGVQKAYGGGGAVEFEGTFNRAPNHAKWNAFAETQAPHGPLPPGTAPETGVGCHAFGNPEEGCAALCSRAWGPRRCGHARHHVFCALQTARNLALALSLRAVRVMRTFYNRKCAN